MKKKIMLHNKEVEYSIRRSKRARRLRIAVYPNASVVVTVPRIFIGSIDSFLKQKADWVLKKIIFFNNLEDALKIVGGKDEYIKNKKEAHEIVTRQVEKINKFYNFSYNKIAIRNQKTRWGSCSTKRNLNFNYKLMFLPEDLAEYIVAHELCHLKEFNHSYKFWNLVAKTIPDYKERIKKIKGKPS